MNSDTIWNESFVVSTDKTIFQWEDWLLQYISFGSYKSQTTERTKALNDM